MVYKILPSKPKNWIKEHPDQLGIIILRSMFALLWISQAMVKLVKRNNSDINADFNGFLDQLYWMRDSHPIELVSSLIDKILIPYHLLFLFLVIFTELLIGTSLGLGIFTRLGSLLGMLMSLTLWLLTLGWDEWVWTYPLIFAPHLLFLLAGSGKIIGLDRVIVTNNKLIRYLQ